MADTNLDQKIAEAKAAGYTDEEIQSYLNPQTPMQEEKDRSEEYTGMAQAGGLKTAQLGAELGGGYLAGKKLLQTAGKALRPPAPPAAAPVPSAPVAPVELPPGHPFLQPQAGQQPVGGAAAEQGSTFLQRFGQQLSQMRQAVAPVIEAVPAAARMAAPAAAALMPGNVGQNYGSQFPQTGPYRGMEINPTTRRPWTPDELNRYNAQYQ